jgi:hypothetical protein
MEKIYDRRRWVTAGIKAAAKALGWHLTVLTYDVNNFPSGNTALLQALQAKPDYIGYLSLPASVIGPGLDAAKAAGIPTFSTIAPEPPSAAAWRHRLHLRLGPIRRARPGRRARLWSDHRAPRRVAALPPVVGSSFGAGLIRTRSTARRRRSRSSGLPGLHLLQRVLAVAALHHEARRRLETRRRGGDDQVAPHEDAFGDEPVAAVPRLEKVEVAHRGLRARDRAVGVGARALGDGSV